jgi:hypothetical protein
VSEPFSLAGLAPLYVTVLRLIDRGDDDAAIAAELRIEVEAVPALILLAQAKRAALAPEAGADPNPALRPI